MAGSLEPILRPHSLAVVGVSSRPDSLSGKLLGNLVAARYAGTVHPVNPRVPVVHGFPCHPSVRAIPEPPDLAIIMVPKDAVLQAMEECLEAGVKGLVVITAGFREAGTAGAELERRIVERVRGAGVRMIGPNCMGVINTEPGISMDASFTPAPALPGVVAFASHSGALGVAVLEAAREVGLGFSYFVSLGNGADVDVNELLEVWEHDGRVRVIMLYLESLPQPQRFLELVSRISRLKPVVVFKGGRTAAGQRAASSHTGALAAGDTAVDALLRQSGAVQARTLEEMFDLTHAFSRAPLPLGRRVAVVTNAGGPAIAAADALAAHSLSLAELSPATQEALRGFLPPEAAVGDPVDMLPSATPDNFRQALELVAGDSGVDAVLTITVTPIVVTPLQIASGLASARCPVGKPVLSVFMTSSRFFPEAAAIQGLPALYRYPEAAVRSLSGLAAYATEVSRPPAQAAPAAARAAVETVRRSRAGYLPPAEAFAFLEGAGVAVAPFRVAAEPASVKEAAEAVGFPVVLKAFGDQLVHKSELGAVVVGLNDSKALGRALAAIGERLSQAGVRADGYLVQGHVIGGREVILGVKRDPLVGPLVMVGLGGVAVEVWKDVSFRVAPVTCRDAQSMLDELKGGALLGAFRGHVPGDRAALVEALVRLAAVAAACPEVAECDVNPLLVMDEGRGCVAVDVRVRVER